MLVKLPMKKERDHCRLDVDAENGNQMVCTKVHGDSENVKKVTYMQVVHLYI